MEARCVSDREDLHARKRRWHVSLVRTHDIFEARYESSYLDLRPAAGKSVQDEVAALPSCIASKSSTSWPPRAPQFDKSLHEPCAFWRRGCRAWRVCTGNFPTTRRGTWRLGKGEEQTLPTLYKHYPLPSNTFTSSTIDANHSTTPTKRLASWTRRTATTTTS
jgi:hypothetical protein